MQLPNNLIIKCSYSTDSNNKNDGILLDIMNINGSIYCIIMSINGTIVRFPMLGVTIDNPDLLFKLSTI